MSMDISYPSCKPEIWGGLECTINRVGDNYRDQLLYSNHYSRAEGDIETIATLGIKALRYPVLWEHHQPQKNKSIDWAWTENQLTLICNHNITPIAGLLHHGSGPKFTNLLQTDFADEFASYAYNVASKFPWIEYYTPINEPLTTARFSGLYGYWYPHHKDPLSFATMLLNQVKGVILAMKAIRKINPRAKLIQTEDLAKIHSVECLAYQADFENERRWLTYDFLCGRVTKQHPLWNYFLSIGIEESALTFFLENLCIPDIVGLNYYVTSERYLDDRIELYPECTPGGNAKHKYVDIEAVRVTKSTGIFNLLCETWNRYHLPIAITEAHLCCTREEQMRWFKEVWDESCRAKSKGVDVKAVTAWSLLGAYDWNSLLIQNNRHYESGVFELKDNTLMPTAMTKLISSLANSGDYCHPLLEHAGWWHNASNLSADLQNRNASTNSAGLLIVGKNGPFLEALISVCTQRMITYKVLNYRSLSNTTMLDKKIALYKPWAMIYIPPDKNKNQTYINLQSLPRICKENHIRLMVFWIDPFSNCSEWLDDVAALPQAIKKIDSHTLVINPLAHDDMAVDVFRFIHTALNLLIDEYQGVRHLSDHETLSTDAYEMKVIQNNKNIAMTNQFTREALVI